MQQLIKSIPFFGRMYSLSYWSAVAYGLPFLQGLYRYACCQRCCTFDRRNRPKNTRKRHQLISSLLCQHSFPRRCRQYCRSSHRHCDGRTGRCILDVGYRFHRMCHRFHRKHAGSNLQAPAWKSYLSRRSGILYQKCLTAASNSKTLCPLISVTFGLIYVSVQANTIALSVKTAFDIPPFMTAFFLCVLTSLVILAA